MLDTTFLRWFTGKSLVNAQAALNMVEASLAHGSWLPGSSRKVRAALTKANVATKLGKTNEKALERIGVPEGAPHYSLNKSGWEIAFMLRFGVARRDITEHLRLAYDATTGDNDALRNVIVQAKRFSEDIAEVWAAVGRLDATRPVPVFTNLGLSPTVTATVTTLGATSFTVCPMEYKTVEGIDAKTGRTVYKTVVILHWPEGTRHRTSKYANRTSCCEACGHRISNPYNWVPLVLETAHVPRSLWVGRDCARNLFNVEVDGDLEYTTDGSRLDTVVQA
jgi:hypothetical protein